MNGAAFSKSFGMRGRGARGSSAPPPVVHSPPVLLSTALSNAGSTGSNTVELSGYTPEAGSDRRIFVMASTGGENGTSSIAMQIQGTTGPVPMNLRALLDSHASADPAGAFEVTAVYDLPEANWPGDGPYTITATSDDPTVTTRMGITAGVVGNIFSDPVVAAFDAANTGSITPATEDSLVLALQSTSSYSSSLAFSAGATKLAGVPGTGATSNPYNYGDGFLVGSATHGNSPLTVTTTAVGRPMLALLAYQKG